MISVLNKPKQNLLTYVLAKLRTAGWFDRWKKLDKAMEAAENQIQIQLDWPKIQFIFRWMLQASFLEIWCNSNI